MKEVNKMTIYTKNLNNAEIEDFMEVANSNETKIYFDAAVELMDDKIREDLNLELAPCTDQEFFTAYEKAHAEKFGEEWELSKSNPVW